MRTTIWSARRWLALLIALGSLLPVVSLAAPAAKPAAEPEDVVERDALTNAPCADTLTRVEAQITVDGKAATYHFGTLYNCLSWIFMSEDKGHKVDWPPQLSMRDLSAKPVDGKPGMRKLPLGMLKLDKVMRLSLVAMPGERRKDYGPWIVTTDEELLGSSFPNALLYTDLTQAVHQAADWHGAVYSWDDATTRLAEVYLQISATTADINKTNQSIYQEYVAPDEPGKAPIIPGGQDELQH